MKKGKTSLKVTLQGVNGKDLILIHYGEECKDDIKATTLLDFQERSTKELQKSKSKKVRYVLDTTKSNIKLWAPMFDLVSNSLLPKETTIPCRWDHHSFSTSPIICPTNYVSGERARRVVREFGLSSDEYFEGEGMFCSFPCVLAYINSKRGNTRYKKSRTYLTRMYSIAFGVTEEYSPAPPFDIIDTYGGHLTINEYRQTFGKLLYKPTVNTYNPVMFLASQYIRELPNVDETVTEVEDEGKILLDISKA